MVDIKEKKKILTTFGKILKYMLKNEGLVFFAGIICVVVSAIVTMYSILFSQELVDSYIVPLVNSQSQNFAPLLNALIRLAVIMGAGVLASLAYSQAMVFVGQKTMTQLRADMFQQMEKLSINYFDTHQHGDIMSLYTNDVDTLRQLFTQGIPQMINSVITVAASFISLVVLSPTLAAIAFVSFVIMTIVTIKITGKSDFFFKKQQQDIGTIDGYIEEMLEGQKVVQVFCHEEQAKKDFHAVNEELRDSSNNANAFANILMPVNEGIGNISYIITGIVGVFLLLSGYGQISIGIIIAGLSLNKNVCQPIAQISQQFSFLIMATAGADRIFELLEETPEVDEGVIDLVYVEENANHQLTEAAAPTKMMAWKIPGSNQSCELRKLTGEIVFKEVDFSYSPKKKILHNINLFAKSSQKLAFVGTTGAGKTTITNLINRFYDIQKGQIYYDGIDIKTIKKSALRRSLGMVLQDTNLFSGTIMDNIRYGNLTATDEECIAAAKLANADGCIQALPDGYNTIISGSDGVLSQGERQLLSIARAAVAKPPVLILDEATSSIDTKTEELVQKGMDALMNNRTSFVIAHRLSTVKNSDCIMVMEQGEIIERGNHQQLIDRKEKYYQLYTGDFEDAEAKVV